MRFIKSPKAKSFNIKSCTVNANCVNWLGFETLSGSPACLLSTGFETLGGSPACLLRTGFETLGGSSACLSTKGSELQTLGWPSLTCAAYKKSMKKSWTLITSPMASHCPRPLNLRWGQFGPTIDHFPGGLWALRHLC